MRRRPRSRRPSRGRSGSGCSRRPTSTPRNSSCSHGRTRMTREDPPPRSGARTPCPRPSSIRTSRRSPRSSAKAAMSRASAFSTAPRAQGRGRRLGGAGSPSWRGAVPDGGRALGQARVRPADPALDAAHAGLLERGGTSRPSDGSGSAWRDEGTELLVEVMRAIDAGRTQRMIAEDVWGEAVAAEWGPDSWMRSRVRRLIPKARALADGGWRTRAVIGERRALTAAARSGTRDRRLRQDVIATGVRAGCTGGEQTCGQGLHLPAAGRGPWPDRRETRCLARTARRSGNGPTASWSACRNARLRAGIAGKRWNDHKEGWNGPELMLSFMMMPIWQQTHALRPRGTERFHRASHGPTEQLRSRRDRGSNRFGDYVIAERRVPGFVAIDTPRKLNEHSALQACFSEGANCWCETGRIGFAALS